MQPEVASASQNRGATFATAPVDMPIPEQLNLALVLGVFAAALGLLWLGSQVTQWWAVLVVGIVFSYLLLTNYALLHEASHGNLQSSARRNYLLGLLAGALFPMPFTLMRSTHQGHHDYNRTDVEMFDLYYPNDNRVIKYIRWYGILCGFFWPLVPLGAVLFSISPTVMRNRLFGRFKPRGYLLNGIHDVAVWAVRFETLLIVAFFSALFFAKRPIGLACLPIPILIAFSRMYLGAHYLSDVVCAAVLGFLCALLVAHFLLREIANSE